MPTIYTSDPNLAELISISAVLTNSMPSVRAKLYLTNNNQELSAVAAAPVPGPIVGGGCRVWYLPVAVFLAGGGDASRKLPELTRRGCR